jgi:hypothetical protein
MRFAPLSGWSQPPSRCFAIEHGVTVRLMCMAVIHRGHERSQGLRCNGSANAKRLALDGASPPAPTIRPAHEKFIATLKAEACRLCCNVGHFGAA